MVGDFPYCDNPYIFALIELSEYPQSENSIAKKLIAGTTFWVYQTRIPFFTKNGPSGNRTRVLGFEAQEDVLSPMDPSHLLYIKRY